MMRHTQIIYLLALLLPTAATTMAQDAQTRRRSTQRRGLGTVARVGDVTHLQGQGKNVLVAHGLVTGLNGTGDNSKYGPTIRGLAQALRRFGVTVDSLEELVAAKNVATVLVRAEIPDHGAREGELLDVTVTALAAKSLAGGQLLPTPLIYHDPTVDGLFAFASGAIEVDPANPNSGVIRQGARMEIDVFTTLVATGSQLRADGLMSPWIRSDRTYITLVLDDAHAGSTMAAAVAQAVDAGLQLSVPADVQRVALAIDAKNIVVLLPEHQRGDPMPWIRDVERTPVLMESNEARVSINRLAGTIVISGDTRISPVVISQAGLTVTVANPLPDGTTPRRPFEEQSFVPIDAVAQRQPNVEDLLEALNRLNVPFKDRVSILEEMHRAGRLHAKLLYEG